MANSWTGNKIKLDTANDDGSYDSANDFVGGGKKYSTQQYKIRKIQIVGGANTNAVNLKECSTSSLAGNDIVNVTLETGDLNKQIDFGSGIIVNGIIPVTLGGSSKIIIHIA